MKAIATLAILGFAAASTTNDIPHITHSHVENIKEKVDFEVFNHEEHPFKNYSLQELKQRLGAIESISNEEVFYGDEKLNAELPQSFDSRQQWPECIGAIRDQGQCGSCWAFAATSVLADRACISGQTKGHVAMSPQQLVSCDKTSYGCQGGYPNKSWEYIQTHGTVTETCYPYTSGTTRQTGTCMTVNNRCKKDAGLSREDFVTYKVVDNKRFNTIVAAKEAISKRGPVEAAFMVYEDFMSYKGGIYVHKTGDLLGGHAVKVIGYGAENGVEYWIVANSWTEKWGEKGYFRVAMGQKALKFENDLRTGLSEATTMNTESFLEY
jgi:cathepsin B